MTAVPQEYPDIVGAKPEGPPQFEPYIPAERHLRELTTVPVIMGTILGMIFGASSLYLVLKTGLTVSASIPVAVIAITLFRLLSKVKTIPSAFKLVLKAVSVIVGFVIFYFLTTLGISTVWSAVISLFVIALLV